MRLFKPRRSKFGDWVEEEEISQRELSKRSGLSDAVISALANGTTKKPSRLTEKKLSKTLQEFGVDTRDFWDV